MTARLTRRERAALALALEVLRAGMGEPWPRYCHALEVLRIGGVLPAQPRHWTTAARGASAARLALYLRARLRADRGDDAPSWVWVWPDGRARPMHSREFAERIAKRRGGYVRPITPLWQRAGEARR